MIGLKSFNRVVGVISFLILFGVYSFGQGQPKPPDAGGRLQDTEAIRKKVEQLGPDLYRVGDVEVNAASKEISFAGEINMATGLAEVVVCAEWGKLHESIVRTKIQPIDLHIALLLLGAKDGKNPFWLSTPLIERERKESRPDGQLLDVFLLWDTPQGPQQCRIEELLMDVRSKEALPQTQWIFTGSYLDHGGGYVADHIGSIITNYHDPSAVIDCPLEQGQVDDYMYIHSTQVPPIGTPVKVLIKVPVLSDK